MDFGGSGDFGGDDDGGANPARDFETQLRRRKAMIEKSKAWQTWIPVWFTIFLMAAGWACTIFYQAGRSAEALQNVVQLYKNLDGRLDSVSVKVDNMGAKVDQITGYLRATQQQRMLADPPARR